MQMLNKILFFAVNYSIRVPVEWKVKRYKLTLFLKLCGNFHSKNCMYDVHYHWTNILNYRTVSPPVLRRKLEIISFMRPAACTFQKLFFCRNKCLFNIWRKSTISLSNIFTNSPSIESTHWKLSMCTNLLIALLMALLFLIHVCMEQLSLRWSDWTMKVVRFCSLENKKQFAISKAFIRMSVFI